MREPNYSLPLQNRAVVVISSALYDRRALDCTATLPLLNSLTHLAYMTSTSPRIREILASDGGLERLVKILATCQHSDRHSLWKWSLAFQCLVNVGVRGTEAIRRRVVDAGGVHVVLAILENFLRAQEQSEADRDHDRHPPCTAMPSNSTRLATAPITTLPPSPSRSTPAIPFTRRALGHPPAACSTDTPLYAACQQHQQPHADQPSFTIPRRRTFFTRTPKPKSSFRAPSLTTIPLLTSLPRSTVLHREEDILMSLQLLAYLSKYPHIRESFHHGHRCNVFSVVEKFTHRSHPPTIIYWAGVIMRNACRKDESKGGLRQCAYLQCGKWERYTREFAKCRRCRKAKYCSKNCQSKAWAEGHRWWCIERHPTTDAAAAATNTIAAIVADRTAVMPQAPRPDQTTPLTATATTTIHGDTPDVMPITMEDRPGELSQVDSDNALPDNTDNDTPDHALVLATAHTHSGNNHPIPDHRASLLEAHAMHQ